MTRQSQSPAARISDLAAEYSTLQRQARAAAAVAVAVLGAGSVFYHYIEHFSWLDAFYFCTITLSTIGYGDLVPKTGAGKLFTIFYVLLGIGIIAFLANVLIRNAVLRRELRRSKHESD